MSDEPVIHGAPANTFWLNCGGRVIAIPVPASQLTPAQKRAYCDGIIVFQLVGFTVDFRRRSDGSYDAEVTET